MTNGTSARRKDEIASPEASPAAAPAGEPVHREMPHAPSARTPHEKPHHAPHVHASLPIPCIPGMFVPGCGRAIDRSLNFLISRFTLGLAPAALAEVYFDWLVHLTASPGKQTELAQQAFVKSTHLLREVMTAAYTQEKPQAETTEATDKRFRAPEWNIWPFNLIRDAFLLEQSWWDTATNDVHGMTEPHMRVASFVARQLLDMAAPSNFIATNPVVLNETVSQMGGNLVRGTKNLFEDLDRVWTGQPPVGAENFKVGENIAITPGKVVFRNDLIELIQYEPTTAKVHAEPVLIVPAWIMKYYILDLSPENSLVKYLCDQGFTVFMISWKNPTARERDYGMDDYRRHGVMAALETVERIVPGEQVHGVGYCLGGTLLTIAAAAMGAESKRFKSLSLFAAQVDFVDAGELTLFISESQIAFLEDTMHEQGYLEGFQMAGTFQLLRSNDLIWSRIVRDYLMGERMPMSDLMAWNSDATRMPARMHGEYLRHLYLDNELSGGHYKVEGRPIALTNIRTPFFVIGTETDHVAPWKSVYKLNLFTDAPVTFALTTGGHNAGVVSPPANSKRAFRIATRQATDAYVDPDHWFAETPRQQGSWWPAWIAWLEERSSGRKVAPPRMGLSGANPTRLEAAPGTYVYER